MINKPVRVILLENARRVFEGLCRIGSRQLASSRINSAEIQLLRAIGRKIALLKRNPFYGNNIPKRLIPSAYNAQNLWRVELPNFWRMLYTIRGSQTEVVCFVLDILNHKDYDKRFGYVRN